MQLQVLYDGGLQSSNAYSLTLYDSLLSPVFASLTGPGCSAAAVDAATGLWPTYSGCYATDDAQLTVTGALFNSTSVIVQSSASRIWCNPVPSPPANSTAVVCSLGGVANNAAALQSASPFYIVNTSPGWLSTHIFYVRFAQPPAAGGGNGPQPAEGGDGTAAEGGNRSVVSGGAIAAVVVCSMLGVMALAGVGWWQWRRRVVKRGEEGMVERQGGYVDSESYRPPSSGGEVALAPFARL